MSQLYSKNQRLKHEPADKDLVQLLMDKLGVQALVGKSMTCQAMLAESWSMISGWSQAGYFGVEMEVATLFAVSNYFAVPSAAMLVVSDNLIEGVSVLDERYKDWQSLIDASRQKVQRVALEVLFQS